MLEITIQVKLKLTLIYSKTFVKKKKTKNLDGSNLMNMNNGSVNFNNATNGPLNNVTIPFNQTNLSNNIFIYLFVCDNSISGDE
jgi:hypothetical protein